MRQLRIVPTAALSLARSLASLLRPTPPGRKRYSSLPTAIASSGAYASRSTPRASLVAALSANMTWQSPGPHPGGGTGCHRRPWRARERAHHHGRPHAPELGDRRGQILLDLRGGSDVRQHQVAALDVGGHVVVAELLGHPPQLRHRERRLAAHVHPAQQRHHHGHGSAGRCTQSTSSALASERARSRVALESIVVEDRPPLLAGAAAEEGRGVAADWFGAEPGTVTADRRRICSQRRRLHAASATAARPRRCRAGRRGVRISPSRSRRRSP